MNILNITFKDLQIFFKDRGSALQLFVLPLVFIFVFSGIGSISDGEVDTAVPLPVINLDEGEAAQTLLANIAATGAYQTVLLAQPEADSQLEAGDIDWLLKIPATFSADLAANQPTDLRMIAHPDADNAEVEAVRLAVDSAAQDLLLKSQILDSLRLMGAMQAANAPEHQAFSEAAIVAQVDEQFERAEERPLITITQSRPGQTKAAEPEPFSGPNVTVPGFTVLFVFLAAGATAVSIYNEKKLGSFRRLLAAPLPKSQLLLGKMLPTFFIALIQVSVIFLIGIFLMPLLGMPGLTLGEDPLAVVVIVIVMALCAAGLGVLIAAFARTESQIGGGSAVLLWVMGALGGAFFPTFLLEGFLGQAGKAVPHYWAGKALYGVLARGQSLSDITTEIAILLGFTLLFWLVGVWRFDFD
jgi:ABC-2 type transport system permease protein